MIISIIWILLVIAFTLCIGYISLLTFQIIKLEQENRVMKKAAECKSRVFSYGKYAEELKILAKAVKNCEMYAIEKTALLMCDHILFRAIVIPIPGRDGYATYMREVAKCMSDVRPDIQVLDICKGKRRGSWCSWKKGMRKLGGKVVIPPPSYFRFKLTENPKKYYDGRDIYFIDNMGDTLTTITYAMTLVENSKGLVLAMTESESGKKESR